MQLQGSQMEDDDPTPSYMLQVTRHCFGIMCSVLAVINKNILLSVDTNFQAWARICKCLGQEFLPYMSVVMPPLLHSAQLKPDVTITSADSDIDFDQSDDER